MNICIRDADLEDLPRIVEIYNEAVIEGFCVEEKQVTLTQKQEWFTNTDPCFVYLKDGIIVGWVSLDPFSPAPVFAQTKCISLYVTKGARGQGVGKTLLKHVMSIAKANKVSVFAPIWENNVWSINFFCLNSFETAIRFPAVGFRNGHFLSLLFLRSLHDCTNQLIAESADETKTLQDRLTASAEN